MTVRNLFMKKKLTILGMLLPHVSYAGNYHGIHEKVIS